MDIDEFDDLLRETARREYHPPPPTPRDAIWARLEAARHGQGEPGPSQEQRPGLGISHGHGTGRVLAKPGPTWTRRPWWGLGLAATLALGIGIAEIAGWWGATEPAFGPPTVAPTATATAFGLAALAHLDRTEVLLTAFRADARAGRVDLELATSSQELLTHTRLLLDSPAAQEPQIEALLRDLELVLVQIAQYPANQTEAEFDLIDQALADHDIVQRLRMTVPAGPLMAHS